MKIRQAIDSKRRDWDFNIAEASERIGPKLVRERNRWLCRNDLFYLCCLVGNDKIAEYPDYYKPFCDEVSLMNWELVDSGVCKPGEDMFSINEVIDDKSELVQQRLYLCHRVFYKTTIITKVHSLQLLLNFPNIHIVLCHNKQENASDNLVTIKNYFLTTKLREWFPEYIPNTKEWGNMTGFSVACRTDWSRSEDNIEAVGVDTEITGRHYQVAKKNDLVTEKSVGTDDQIKKTIEWDERFNIGMFDDPQTKIQDYEGTRYHFADMYSLKKNDPTIKYTQITLVNDLKKFLAGDDTQISNPKRFTRDGIKGLMRDMWVFNCQMMLNPEDPAKMQFKQEMIQYFSSIPKDINYYLLVDPASARKKRSDFTVMLIVGLDITKKKYLVDGIRDKLDPKQRVDKAIELSIKWQIRGCGWEAIAFQDTDCFYLEEARRLKNLHWTPEPIKSHTVAKEDRIRSLVPEYAQHEWFWPQKGSIVQLAFDGRKYCITEELEYEFRQFPLCEHDDLLDTQTFLNRISTIKPVSSEPEPEHEMTFGEYAEDTDLNNKLKNLVSMENIKITPRV